MKQFIIPIIMVLVLVAIMFVLVGDLNGNTLSRPSTSNRLLTIETPRLHIMIPMPDRQLYPKRQIEFDYEAIGMPKYQYRLPLLHPLKKVKPLWYYRRTRVH